MKELWLFTMRYPFGVGEAFLENEVPVLCARFEKVRIFPEHRDSTMRAVPANAEVCLPVNDPYQRATWRELFRYRGQIGSLLRSLRNDAPSFRSLWKERSVLRNRIGHLIHRAAMMERAMLDGYDPVRTILYTYWLHDWVVVLGLLHERGVDLEFVSRAHGFDLFEAQNKDGWIPFRQFHLRHVSRVFAVSETGRSHLQGRHPEKRDMFMLSQLGTMDHGMAPIPVDGPLHIVSCSFLVPRKRVLNLIQALALVRRPIRWTHFGSGPEEADVRAAIAYLPEHVQVELRGDTPNAEIMAWYRTHAVDAFIHLSALEGGVAVAVQEAASFGIPVIATDSGGVRAIVGPGTGVLLPNEASSAQVAAQIEELRESAMATKEFRLGARSTWARQFEAGSAFGRFVDDLVAWKERSAREH